MENSTNAGLSPSPECFGNHRQADPECLMCQAEPECESVINVKVHSAEGLKPIGRCELYGQYDDVFQICRACSRAEGCKKLSGFVPDEVKQDDTRGDEDAESVQSLDPPDETAQTDISWFESLPEIRDKGKVVPLPDDLKSRLYGFIAEAQETETLSRSTEHPLVAIKGRIFCSIRDALQGYKDSNKGLKLPVEFTATWIAKRVFGRCKQTVFTWAKVWTTYADDLKTMTDLTIAKLYLLADLDETTRKEWLSERRQELADMDEDAVKALVRGEKKPAVSKPRGKFVNGYRVVANSKHVRIEGMTVSMAVELENLEKWFLTQSPGVAQPDETEAPKEEPKETKAPKGPEVKPPIKPMTHAGIGAGSRPTVVPAGLDPFGRPQPLN